MKVKYIGKVLLALEHLKNLMWGLGDGSNLEKFMHPQLHNISYLQTSPPIFKTKQTKWGKCELVFVPSFDDIYSGVVRVCFHFTFEVSWTF